MGHNTDDPRQPHTSGKFNRQDASGGVQSELTRAVRLLVEDFSALLSHVRGVQERIDAVDRMVGTRHTPQQAQLISVTAAARRLGVSRATMYRMIDLGQIEVVIAGATKKVSTQWLDDFVNGRVGSPHQPPSI